MIKSEGSQNKPLETWTEVTWYNYVNTVFVAFNFHFAIYMYRSLFYRGVAMAVVVDFSEISFFIINKGIPL